MKKVGLVTAAIIFFCIGVVIFYNKQYPIKVESNAVLEAALTSWIDKNDKGTYNKITIIEKKDIQNSNSLVVLFYNDTDISTAFLNKGFFNKYKIDFISTTNGVNKKVIDTSNGKYIVISGKNSEMKINHLKGELSNSKYNFNADISKEAFFIINKEFPSILDENEEFILSFYDKEGKDITSEIINK